MLCTVSTKASTSRNPRLWANDGRVCGSAGRCASTKPAATHRTRRNPLTIVTARIERPTDLCLPLGRHHSMLGHLISWESQMIYELRVYHCVPGRLPDLMKRFDTITLKLWAKHGIQQAGFWTTLVGDSNQDLTYFLKWESLAEREAKMGKFGADPEWQNARAETEKNGAIVAPVANTLLPPTSFSSV